MTTPAHRINELQKRQRYDGSSMFVRLFAVDGYFHYEVCLDISTDETTVFPWVDFWKLNLKKNTGGQKIPIPENHPDAKLVQANIERQCVIMTGKYEGQDPEDFLKFAETVVGKWKCGKQIKSPMECSL